MMSILILGQITADAIPSGPLYGAVIAMGTAICFIFKMLIDSQERRHAETLKHHDALVESTKAERVATNLEREAHAKRLEDLVQSIATERGLQLREMTAALTGSIEAIRANTLAREKSVDEIKGILNEVPRVVLATLVDMGLLVPLKAPLADKGKPPFANAPIA